MNRTTLEILGVAKKPPARLKPNPKDLRPVLHFVKELNRRFYRPERKREPEIAWYGFLPWVDNPEKKWYIICSCIATARDPWVQIKLKIIQRQNPELKVEIQSIYGAIHFAVQDGYGSYI